MTRRRTFLAAAAGGFATAGAGCMGMLGAGGTETEATTAQPTTREPLTVDGAFRQYLYDAANTGLVRETTGPTGEVATAFEFGGAGVPAGHTIGTPAVVDGTLYVTEGSQSEDDTARSVVYALDATDGSVNWQRSYEGTNVTGSVTVVDDVVPASFSGNLKARSRSRTVAFT